MVSPDKQRALRAGLVTEKTSPGVKAGLRKGVEVSGTRMGVKIQDVDEDGRGYSIM